MWGGRCAPRPRSQGPGCEVGHGGVFGDTAGMQELPLPPPRPALASGLASWSTGSFCFPVYHGPTADRKNPPKLCRQVVLSSRSGGGSPGCGDPLTVVPWGRVCRSPSDLWGPLLAGPMHSAWGWSRCLEAPQQQCLWNLQGKLEALGHSHAGATAADSSRNASRRSASGCKAWQAGRQAGGTRGWPQG